MNNEKQKNTLIYTYATILILTLASFVFFYYKEAHSGILRINANNEQVGIFVDTKEKGLFDIGKKGKIFKLSEGSHSIIISKKDFWPWTTKVNVSKTETIDIYPFFVPQSTNGFLISKEDSEYKNIITKFENTKTHIDWNKNGETPKIIKDFKSEIRMSDFYKERDDVIIIAVSNGIFALEINNNEESIPNFQPIYKGVSPEFVKKDNNTIYVRDNGNLMEVAY